MGKDTRQHTQVNPAELLNMAAQLTQMAASILTETAANTPANRPIHVSAKSLEAYGLGPDCVKAAIEKGELKASLGSRRRLLVSEADLIAWRDSRPVRVRPRRDRQITGENIDLIDQMLARGELRRVGGGR